MTLFALIILVVSCALNAAGASRERFGSVPCRRCHSLEDCLREPTELDCPYGYFPDKCGYFNCNKGPGDECDDHIHSIKICAQGLHCSGTSKKCLGCVLEDNYVKCFQPTSMN